MKSPANTDACRTLYYSYIALRLHHRDGDIKQIVVETRADAEEGNAQSADCQRNLCGTLSTERRQWCIGLLDIHGLDRKQVVVE